ILGTDAKHGRRVHRPNLFETNEADARHPPTPNHLRPKRWRQDAVQHLRPNPKVRQDAPVDDALDDGDTHGKSEARSQKPEARSQKPEAEIFSLLAPGFWLPAPLLTLSSSRLPPFV